MLCDKKPRYTYTNPHLSTPNYIYIENNLARKTKHYLNITEAYVNVTLRTFALQQQI